MVLGGIGSQDANGRKNFFVVDSKTRAQEIQEVFTDYTSRKDVAIVLISQVRFSFSVVIFLVVIDSGLV